VNILDAIRDENLFRPFLGDDLSTWKYWGIALRALYGIPIKSLKGRAFVQQCTGRDASELPAEGFQSALFLVGRRSGKSRIAAVIGGFEALFGGHEKRLAKGETGIIPIISPSKFQSGIVWKYIRGLFDVPLLKQEVVNESERDQTITLQNGIEIRILTGDWRTVRGPSVVCAIIDEVCFFGVTEESKVRSDTELVRALRPALLTTKGKLIGISSKYAQKGWAYGTWKKQHGANKGDAQFNPKWRTLVWDTDSRTMNPTLSEAEIAAAYEEDPAAARSEFGGCWREDIEEFVPRSMIESLVAANRRELLPRSLSYSAGVDLSGGRGDSAALCIVHKEERRVVQDFIKEWHAPFNPYSVVSEIASELKRWNLRSVRGDNYAGDWPVQAFREHGIRYLPADRSKSELYREMLPVLCGGKASIELLDNATLVNQLASLERKTRSGGNDVIDHPRGGKDDVANALAVACSAASQKRLRAGGLWRIDLNASEEFPSRLAILQQTQ